jgi:4-hydroxy-4-methyl-2-oxoglutarate aldolase
MMKNLLLLLFVFPCILRAQQVTLTSDQIKALTPDWKGERSADGRPKVSDAMLERLKKISIEEAWGILRNRGFQNQYEGDWPYCIPTRP